MLNLHNLSEDVQSSQQELAERIGEVTRERGTRSTDETFARLIKEGKSDPKGDAIYKALCEQKITLVITAHPTQALRRSLLKKNADIRKTLTALHSNVKMNQFEKTDMLDFIQSNIEAAFRTDELSRKMTLPEDDDSWSYNLTIPVALMMGTDADKFIQAYDEDPLLLGSMNWTNNIPQGAKVEWEYWISSDDACGVKCEKQKQFAKDFAPIAQILEQNGWTEFTPHYMMWTCPMQYRNTTLCDNLCIEGGEYCAPDPEQDEEAGYDGKDVVIENRRQICIYKQANASGEPWVWWDFVQKFDEECSMTKQSYDKECSERAFLDVGGAKLGGGLAALALTRIIVYIIDNLLGLLLLFFLLLLPEDGRSDGQVIDLLLQLLRSHGASLLALKRPLR